MMGAFLLSASLAAMFSLILYTVTLQADAKPVAVNGNTYHVDTILTRDITVIGGGGSGTFAAIRLTDMGKSVAVIEQKNRLGGHAETFTDPQTGHMIDLGVVVFHNTTIVNDYFKRLNVALVKGDLGRGNTKYADFRTGKVNPDYASVDPHNISIALGKYAAQLSKYPYLETGFDLPDPVPADLLLPFGDFVKRYDLEDFVGSLFSFAQGLGNLLEQPTLYVFKNIGMGVIRSSRPAGFLTAAPDNSLLYEHATAELGENVFLSSKILQVDRSGSEVKILVQTPTGKALIKSQKLVFTVPPKLDNLQGWDLSQSETKLFKQFGNSAYYTAVVRNTGIPHDISSVVNIGVDTLYNIPTLPGIYSVRQTSAPGLFLIKFGSPCHVIDVEVQNGIRRAIKRLKLDGKGKSEPELVAYSSHTPFELTVPSRAIAKGFYKELNGLQGHRYTYYTGAAFHTHDSSLLWEFTEGLLPSVIAGLVTGS